MVNKKSWQNIMEKAGDSLLDELDESGKQELFQWKLDSIVQQTEIYSEQLKSIDKQIKQLTQKKRELRKNISANKLLIDRLTSQPSNTQQAEILETTDPEQK